MKKDKSMIDEAYDILSSRNSLDIGERPISFAELYDQVAANLQMEKEERDARIGHFYSDLTFDGRFVELAKEGKWDLRSNHTFDAVHIDINDIYSSEEAKDDDKEEEAEEKKEEGDLTPDLEDEEGDGGSDADSDSSGSESEGY